MDTLNVNNNLLPIILNHNLLHQYIKPRLSNSFCNEISWLVNSGNIFNSELRIFLGVRNMLYTLENPGQDEFSAYRTVDSDFFKSESLDVTINKTIIFVNYPWK